MIFENRRAAGKALAAKFEGLSGGDILVLGLPRGGVEVAFEIAKALESPLDVLIARKIGVPYNPELALGAISSDGTVVLDQEILRSIGVSEGYIQREIERQTEEIERRIRLYRGERMEVSPQGKIVILVDDGVATGSTLKAGIITLKKRNPQRLIVAVPVGPDDTLQELGKLVDQVVYLHAPELFFAVGQFYRFFDQTTDEEVRRLLSESLEWSKEPKTGSFGVPPMGNRD